MLRQIIAFAALPLLASCVAPREAAVPMPAPAPAPRPAPAPAPVAVVDRYQGDWSVDPLTPGEWTWQYRDGKSWASFLDGSPYPPAILACSNGQIIIGRSGILPQDIRAVIRIRASSGERELPVRSVNQQTRWIESALPPSDPLWDQIVYSRGRFVIETTMQSPLILPTGPELQRVVEDCRG